MKHIRCAIAVLSWTLFFSLIVPIYAEAQTDDDVLLEVSGSYSYVRGNFTGAGQKKSSYNGWETTLTMDPGQWFNFEFDFAGRYNSSTIQLPAQIGTCPPVCLPAVSVDSTEHEYLFGPRIHYPKKRVSPFAHILFGASHVTSHATFPLTFPTFPVNLNTSQTGFAMVAGGGVDVKISKHVFWRNQMDYFLTNLFNRVENNARFSTGFTIRLD